MNKSIKKAVTSLSIFTLAIFISSTSFAATTPCKGQSQETCSQNNACAWVNSYKRKDGKTIRSYCRNSAKSKLKMNKSDTIKQTPTKTIKQQSNKTSAGKTSTILEEGSKI
jgi:hypothetical protein